MAKPAHFDESHLYPTHLTLVTRWRIPHFKDQALALACLKAIEHERARIALPVLAFALMPDHFHLVIGPATMPLGFIVHALKNASVHRLKADRLAAGGLWQEGYFDRGLRDETQLRAAIDYVHRNPVEAALVADPRDYPLSSCAAWEGVSQSLLRLAVEPELVSSFYLSL